MMTTEVVPATTEHFLRAFGQMPKVTVKAWALVDGDQVLGIAGWYLTSAGPLVFSEICQPLPKLLIYRLSKRFMGAVPSPAFCYSAPTSWGFVQRLGWEHTGRGNEHGAIFRWQPSSPH